LDNGAALASLDNYGPFVPILTCSGEDGKYEGEICAYEERGEPVSRKIPAKGRVVRLVLVIGRSAGVVHRIRSSGSIVNLRNSGKK
jgi:hypothetical protein